MSDSATPWTAAHQAPPAMGFFQARVLEWGAFAFSDMAHETIVKKKKKVKKKKETIVKKYLNSIAHQTTVSDS